MKIHMIDYLAYKLQCNISDLGLHPQYKLFYEVQKIPAEDCTLEEWTECAVYLCHGDNAFGNVQEAKDFLLNRLNPQHS